MLPGHIHSVKIDLFINKQIARTLLMNALALRFLLYPCPYLILLEFIAKYQIEFELLIFGIK